ncbi:MAG: glycosyltransferase family 2 protein [Candidatus Kuenenia sp.]|nr:glycosyltransferase family 2 protein [Candidatus Kuenenia hertensis]
MKLSIIMPVFNEEKTVSEVIERVKTIPIDKEIILVNDASSDGTFDIVKKLASHDIKVIHHPVNHGKGAAIRTGLNSACGDVVVIQDADLEYDPNDFLQMIVPINEKKADVVYGVRLLETQKMVMRLGNRFLTFVTNLVYGQHLKDMETCYKMMRREIALNLDLECRRFDVEAEITAKLLRTGYTIYEVPISYQARYENKKLTPFDGLPALKALWKYRNWNPYLDKSNT